MSWAFVGGSILFVFATSPAFLRPWHVREVLVIDDESDIDGYVLEDEGRWMTVMLNDTRELVRVEVMAVTERRTHVSDSPHR